MIYPILQQGNNLPPTLYGIMQSLVNYDTDEPSKLKDMWQKARKYIFNFDYVLTNNVSRETFEHNILNHYLMRRINYDTVTLFQIMLENKLAEILPKYNMLWDSLDGWDIFKSGTTTREFTDNTTTSNTGNNTVNGSITAENSGTTNTINNTGYSDTPQSKIDDIDSNEYLTEYTHNVADNTITNNTSTTTTNTSTNIDSGNSNKTIKEVVTRTADNEIDLLIKFQTEYNNIWTMLYRDLDCLFYGLV